MMAQYERPWDGVAGTERDEPWLSLEDDEQRVRLAMVGMTRNIVSAVTRSDPMPAAKHLYQRIHDHRPGDLVLETSRIMYQVTSRPPDDREPDWYRGFGYLVEHRPEASNSDAEWDQLIADGELQPDAQRHMDDAWYIQYGQAAGDVCRWSNCDFVVIPITCSHLLGTGR